MSNNVQRLKELLFEPETQALADVSRRIDAVAVADERARDVLRQQIDLILDRVGNGERLSASVSDILSDALRRAEVTNHDELSRAVAPLVVATIKTELRNSQDEMVEALYPITGRLVKAYVASAVKDMTDQINHRIEQNPVMLRLTSLATGRSVAELALAGTQDFKILELFLIRRATGELISRWPQSDGNEREHQLSGILAAINEFANDAFSAEQASLRRIDLGDEAVYLRASPLYLLAALGTGQAPDGVEQLIDESFLDEIDNQRQSAGEVAVLGEALNEKIADYNKDNRSRAGYGVLKALAALILLPIIGWFAFQTYAWSLEARVRSTATSIIASFPEMAGYPVEFEVSPRGRMLVVSGLAPSGVARAKVHDKLIAGLPHTKVLDQISVVPGSGPKPRDFTADVQRVESNVSRLSRNVEIAAARRSCEQAMIALQKAESDLKRAVSAPDSGKTAAFQKARESTAAAQVTVADIRQRLADGTDVDLAAIAKELMRTSLGIDATSTLLLDTALPEPPSAQPATDQEPGDAPLSFASQAIVSAAARLQSLAGAAVFAAFSVPPPVVAPPPEPMPVSGEDRLRTFATRNAIFFGNDVEYRDDAGAHKILAELAPLIAATNNIVRVVGYTDESGGLQRNAPLAQARAERVVEDLKALGVDPARLVAVGRGDSLDLSRNQGAGSPNRRVEFEVGFSGEAAQ